MSLTIVGGDGQEATIGTELPDVLVVKATTRNGNPVPHQLLNFVVVQGGGSVYAGSAVTNAHGIAQEYWTVGPRPGRNVLEVRAVDQATGAKQAYATFVATATPVPVARIVVTPRAATIDLVRTATLSAQLLDASGRVLPNEDYAIAWSSSDDAVARVSQAGVVTGVAAGGPVTVTVSAGGASGTASIRVVLRAVARVDVNAPGTSITVGHTMQLGVTLRDASGVPITDPREVTWESSDEESATVSTGGLVTAIAASPAVTLTATAEGISSGITLAVTDPNGVASITLTPSTTTVAVGAEVVVQATLRNTAGALVRDNPTVDWSVSSAGAAVPSTTVASSGVARANVRGITGSPSAVTVTARVGSASGTAAVVVVARDDLEPNETQSAARPLPDAWTDGPEVVTLGNFHDLVDSDWFRIMAVQGDGAFCLPGTAQRFAFRVTLGSIPGGSDYDLQVVASNGSSTLSRNSGDNPESVTLFVDGVCGRDDDVAFFWVRVIRASGTPTNSQYRLGIQYRRQ